MEQHVAAVANEIYLVLNRFGISALEDREQTAGYFLRRFPTFSSEVEAALRVLYLPRYLDCLEWLVYEPQTDRMRYQYWGHYERLIDQNEGSDRTQSVMHEVNNELLLTDHRSGGAEL